MSANVHTIESWQAGDIVSNGAAWWTVREIRDSSHGIAAARGALVVECSHYANPVVVVTFTEVPGLPARLHWIMAAGQDVPAARHSVGGES